MKSIIYIAFLLTSISFIYAQDSEAIARKIKESEEQANKRTPQEQKLDGSIWGDLIRFENSLSVGVPRNQAMSCFDGFLQDDSSRIYVIIKIHGGNGAAQSAIKKTHGYIQKDYLGSLYSWVRPEALRVLIQVESIIRIDRHFPAKTR